MGKEISAESEWTRPDLFHERKARMYTTIVVKEQFQGNPASYNVSITCNERTVQDKVRQKVEIVKVL